MLKQGQGFEPFFFLGKTGLSVIAESLLSFNNIAQFLARYVHSKSETVPMFLGNCSTSAIADSPQLPSNKDKVSD